MGLALLHSEQAVRVERMEKLIFTRVHAEAGPGVVTGNTFAIQNSLYLEQFPFSLNHCFFFLQKKKKKKINTICRQPVAFTQVHLLLPANAHE